MVAQSKAGGGILLIRGCVGRTRHIAPSSLCGPVAHHSGVEGELFMYPVRRSVLVTVCPLPPLRTPLSRVPLPAGCL